jgi:hypothetical protein
MKLINGKKPDPIIREITPKHCCATCRHHNYLEANQCYFVRGYHHDSGEIERPYTHVCQLWKSLEYQD